MHWAASLNFAAALRSEDWVQWWAGAELKVQRHLSGTGFVALGKLYTLSVPESSSVATMKIKHAYGKALWKPKRMYKWHEL